MSGAVWYPFPPVSMSSLPLLLFLPVGARGPTPATLRGGTFPHQAIFVLAPDTPTCSQTTPRPSLPSATPLRPPRRPSSPLLHINVVHLFEWVLSPLALEMEGDPAGSGGAPGVLVGPPPTPTHRGWPRHASSRRLRSPRSSGGAALSPLPPRRRHRRRSCCCCRHPHCRSAPRRRRSPRTRPTRLVGRGSHPQTGRRCRPCHRRRRGRGRSNRRRPPHRCATSAASICAGPLGTPPLTGPGRGSGGGVRGGPRRWRRRRLHHRHGRHRRCHPHRRCCCLHMPLWAASPAGRRWAGRVGRLPVFFLDVNLRQ